MSYHYYSVLLVLLYREKGEGTARWSNFTRLKFAAGYNLNPEEKAAVKVSSGEINTFCLLSLSIISRRPSPRIQTPWQIVMIDEITWGKCIENGFGECAREDGVSECVSKSWWMYMMMMMMTVSRGKLKFHSFSLYQLLSPLLHFLPHFHSHQTNLGWQKIDV